MVLAVVLPLLDDPEESEAVVAVAGYVTLLISDIDDALLDRVRELVPIIRELRLLSIPPLLDGEATG
jgi:hypothetical protein